MELEETALSAASLIVDASADVVSSTVLGVAPSSLVDAVAEALPDASPLPVTSPLLFYSAKAYMFLI